MREQRRRKKREEEALDLSQGPPYNTEAEKAVLGAMLMETGAVTRAAGMLEPRDFYSPQNQRIFAAMITLLRDERPVDLVTLTDRLGEEATVEVGGLPYLASLQGAASTAAMVPHYARIVKRASVLRQQLVAMESYTGHLGDAERKAALMEALVMGEDESADWLSIDQLLRMDITVEWLIDTLVPLEGVTVLLGDWEMRKSWLALSLCYAMISEEKKWLGYYPIRRQGGALYVDAEVGKPSARDRLAQLEIGAGRALPEVAKPDPWEEAADSVPESPDRPLEILFESGFSLGPRVGALEGKIRDTKARLVVFDSVMAMAPAGFDIYHPSFWFRILPPLKRLAQRTHSSMMLLQHLRKISPGADNSLAARGFGSVAAMAEVDSVIGISGDRTSASKMITHEKARLSRVREPSFYVDFRAGENGGLLVLRGDTVLDEEAEGREHVKEVLRNFTADGEEHTRKELVAVARDVIEGETDTAPSRRMIDTALREMVEADELERLRRGIYRRKETDPWE